MKTAVAQHELAMSWALKADAVTAIRATIASSKGSRGTQPSVARDSMRFDSCSGVKLAARARDLASMVSIKRPGGATRNCVNAHKKLATFWPLKVPSRSTA